MNFCPGHGFVVNQARPLPSDPSDYDVGGKTPTVGCNQLRCARCHKPVRSAAGVKPRDLLECAKLLKEHYNVETKPDTLSQVAALVMVLYDLPDVSGSPLLRPAGSARLYWCLCDYWTALSTDQLENDDPAPNYPNVPWRCSGHPLVTLPHEFDGARAENEKDLVELCKRSLRGWTPPSAHPDDLGGGLWAARLHGRLAQTPWQDAVAAAAADCLDDADPNIRMCAINFFEIRVRNPIGMKRGVELLEKKRLLYAGIPDKLTKVSGNKTLEDSLLAVVRPLATDPGPARELVRADVLTPHRGGYLSYAMLAAFDTEWFVAHAEDIAHATPEHCKDLLSSFSRAPKDFNTQPIVEKLKALLPKADPKRR